MTDERPRVDPEPSTPSADSTGSKSEPASPESQRAEEFPAPAAKSSAHTSSRDALARALLQAREAVARKSSIPPPSLRPPAPSRGSAGQGGLRSPLYGAAPSVPVAPRSAPSSEVLQPRKLEKPVEPTLPERDATAELETELEPEPVTVRSVADPELPPLERRETDTRLSPSESAPDGGPATEADYQSPVGGNPAAESEAESAEQDTPPPHGDDLTAPDSEPAPDSDDLTAPDSEPAPDSDDLTAPDSEPAPDSDDLAAPDSEPAPDSDDLPAPDSEPAPLSDKQSPTAPTRASDIEPEDAAREGATPESTTEIEALSDIELENATEIEALSDIELESATEIEALSDVELESAAGDEPAHKSDYQRPEESNPRPQSESAEHDGLAQSPVEHARPAPWVETERSEAGTAAPESGGAATDSAVTPAPEAGDTPMAAAVVPTPEAGDTPRAVAVIPTPEAGDTPRAAAVVPTPEAGDTPRAVAVVPTPEAGDTPRAVAVVPTPDAHNAPAAAAVSPVPEAPLAADAAQPKASLAAPSARRAVLWVGIVLLVLCAVGLLLALARNKPKPETAPQEPGRVSAVREASPRASSAPASPTPSVPALDAAAPRTEKVRVQLNVRPVGALVYNTGKRLGQAPLTVELQPGETRTLEIAAQGYAVRRLTLDGSREEVTVTLKKRKPAKSKKKTR